MSEDMNCICNKFKSSIAVMTVFCSHTCKFILFVSSHHSYPNIRELFFQTCVSHYQRICSNIGSSPLGQLQLKLMFSLMIEGTEETRGTLHVAVVNARNLPSLGTTKQIDGYVKIYLLPDKSEKGLRKTDVKRNDLNPVWKEEFTYEGIIFGELRTVRVLEVTVMDCNMLSEDVFVGCLRLGSYHVEKEDQKWMDSSVEESGHWEEMLKEPGEWVEYWHSLRPYVNYGHTDFTPIAAPSEGRTFSINKDLGKKKYFKVDSKNGVEKEVKSTSVFCQDLPPLRETEMKVIL